MTPNQQITAFSDDLDNLVDRYRREFDLSYAAVVGVFFMKAHLLCAEAVEEDDDQPPPVP